MAIPIKKLILNKFLLTQFESVIVMNQPNLWLYIFLKKFTYMLFSLCIITSFIKPKPNLILLKYIHMMH